MTWFDTLIEKVHEVVRHTDGDIHFLVREHSKDYLRIVISAGKNHVFIVPKNERAKEVEKV